ncbi:MAG: hypothetical protein U9Q81_26385, partial [Pseudomonadota bacterium]|nr:hypothetical protein [Pseudomonadota bacterium]
MSMRALYSTPVALLLGVLLAIFAPSGALYVIPLPTTLPDAALSLEREHEIGDALQTDPERFRAWEAIVFPV